MGDNDDNDFDIPDLSVDALADKNDSISELKEERDSLREQVDEMEAEIKDALDSAERFTVELDEDECVCEAVEDLVADLDEKAEQAEQVEELQDELKEYREEEREEALDTLEDLGADRDEYVEEDLDTIEEEIDRREEVLDAADADVSVKGTDDEPNESTDSDETKNRGSRSFGRGYSA
jgi:chromosome segregation ATPase